LRYLGVKAVDWVVPKSRGTKPELGQAQSQCEAKARLRIKSMPWCLCSEELPFLSWPRRNANRCLQERLVDTACRHPSGKTALSVLRVVCGDFT